MKPDGISLIVHTRNSSATLPKLLESTSWFDERIIVDCQSDDETVAMAKAAGCLVISTQHEFFTDALRNEFLPLASNSWTMVLDSDEYLAIDAEDEIRRLVSVTDEWLGGYLLPRRNFIVDRFMQGSSFYPDYQFRIFRTGQVHYRSGHHFMPVFMDDRHRYEFVDPINGVHIYHHNYNSLAEFMQKQLHYALTDVYEQSAAEFSFTDVIAQAQETFSRVFDPKSDGSLSYALASIMAWDKIMRGLLQWEEMDYKPPLPDEYFSMVWTEKVDEQVVESDNDELREQLTLLQAENQALTNEIAQMNQRLTMRALRPLHVAWSKLKQTRS